MPKIHTDSDNFEPSKRSETSTHQAPASESVTSPGPGVIPKHASTQTITSAIAKAPEDDPYKEKPEERWLSAAALYGVGDEVTEMLLLIQTGTAPNLGAIWKKMRPQFYTYPEFGVTFDRLLHRYENKRIATNMCRLHVQQALVVLANERRRINAEMLEADQAHVLGNYQEQAESIKARLNILNVKDPSEARTFEVLSKELRLIMKDIAALSGKPIAQQVLTKISGDPLAPIAHQHGHLHVSAPEAYSAWEGGADDLSVATPGPIETTSTTLPSEFEFLPNERDLEDREDARDEE